MKYLLMLMPLTVLVGCTEVSEKIVYTDQGGFASTPSKSSPVTKEFGALVVSAGEFNGATKITPWSSWWFPTKETYMFKSKVAGELAPLQKYDLYTKKLHGADPESAFFEEMEIYDPSEVNWAGLCHAWAVASVLHVEPKSTVYRGDIPFTVGDQKALLLKSYENVGALNIYGSRYNGSFNDDYSDVYPDQFHRLAQVYLFERKLPFLMDYDPSFPVWTVPVYNVKFKITRESDNSAHVKSWVTIASSFVDSPQYVGTKKTVKYYEYKLYGEWIGEELKVTGSEWVNDSLYDHPDYLIGYPDKVTRASLNKKLELDKIDKIVGAKYVTAE